MALIKCKFCGSEISDKAEKCPKCGKDLNTNAVEKIVYIKCEECGALLPADTEVCPNCGFPIVKDLSITDTVGVENKKKAKKKLIIVLGIVLVLALVGSIVFLIHSMKQKELERIQIEEHENRLNEYHNKLVETVELMYSAAAKAEEIADLMREIWINSILEIDSYETNFYTKDKFGNFFPDFNTALQRYVDSSNYSGPASDIKTRQTRVANMMKDLKDYPDEYKDEYNMIVNLYDSFISICDCALNPTGNYEQYSNKLDTGVDSFAKNYQLISSYL